MELKLKPRPVDAHKGTFGTVLVIGGSRGMSGAASLCGSAALISGCGLVRVAVPVVCQDIVASFDRCYTTVGLPCDSNGKISLTAKKQIQEEALRATAIALGPGLGRSEELTQLVIELNQEIDKPMVLDADALNALSQSPDKMFSPHTRIMTPHPGEFARLSAAVAKQTREQQILLASKLADKLLATIVLKGHSTVITDGKQKYVNTTGNSGMATGGAGDVLTGVIVSLLAQGYSPLDAARIGVYIHGRAGDIAAEQIGPISLTAEGIIRFLPQAFREIT